MMKLEQTSQTGRLSDIYEFIRRHPVNETWTKPNIIMVLEQAEEDNGIFYTEDEHRKIDGACLCINAGDWMHCSLIVSERAKDGLLALARIYKTHYPNKPILSATRRGKEVTYQHCIAERIIKLYG